MNQWLEFDKTSGRILQAIEGSSVVVPEETSSLGVLADTPRTSGAAFYVDPDSRVVTARPASSITFAQTLGVVVLSNVAVGTVVTVSGNAQESVTQDATDGGLQLTFTASGVYGISAEQFPEQPFNTTITV